MKARREEETKIHAQLHANIHALTLLYPPDDEFKRVFQKDMFSKNNKAAFQQIVYYLLHLLEPETIKVKVPSWPIYTPKQEAQFRTEIMKYINELHVLYEYGNVPTIMASHLISPGGYRFAKFVLKLTQLVMSVVLQRLDSGVKATFLFPLKVGKHRVEIVENTLGRIKAKTRRIKISTAQIYGDCEGYVEFAHSEAKKIVEEKKIVRERLKTFSKNNNQIPDVVFTYSLILSDLNLDYSTKLLNLALEIQKLISYLFDNEIQLTFNKNTLLPQNIQKHFLRNNNSQIDLGKFFETLTTFISTLRLQKPRFSSHYLTNALERSLKINSWLQLLLRMFDELQERSVRLSASVETVVNRNGNGVLGDDEVLAVPLVDDSPQ